MVQISEEKVIAGAEAGMDEFIKVFTDAYWSEIKGELTADTMPLLTGEQHVLLGYQIFRDEVLEGGFVQLIQNGYGPYIFENPFAKAMRLFCEAFRLLFAQFASNSACPTRVSPS